MPALLRGLLLFPTLKQSVATPGQARGRDPYATTSIKTSRHRARRRPRAGGGGRPAPLFALESTAAPVIITARGR